MARFYCQAKFNSFLKKTQLHIYMDKQDIHIDDIKRILLGQAPPEFLLETFLRTLVVYLFLLLIVRWLGKRMAGQLTITEMSVMLTLGAIVAPAMQMPDRGILLTIFILFGVLLFQRGLNWLSFKSDKIERLTQGTVTLLAEDGKLKVDAMRKVRITQQELFESLREAKIYNLGAVDVIYLEACGVFSVFKFSDKRPGLPLYPPNDKKILEKDGLQLSDICTPAVTVEIQSGIIILRAAIAVATIGQTPLTIN